MADFPLQTDIVDAVVEFANAELSSPDDAIKIFGGTWSPTDMPRLQTCRAAQRDVRQWLLSSEDETVWDVIKSFGGVDDNGICKAPITLTGGLGYRIRKSEDGKRRRQITWRWKISNAPLRAVCALGVMTVWQLNLDDRVRRCRRTAFEDSAECNRIFVDRHSRGKPRKYCLDDTCQSIRNRAAVAASRGK